MMMKSPTQHSQNQHCSLTTGKLKASFCLGVVLVFLGLTTAQDQNLAHFQVCCYTIFGLTKEEPFIQVPVRAPDAAKSWFDAITMTIPSKPETDSDNVSHATTEKKESSGNGNILSGPSSNDINTHSLLELHQSEETPVPDQAKTHKADDTTNVKKLIAALEMKKRDNDPVRVPKNTDFVLAKKKPFSGNDGVHASTGRKKTATKEDDMALMKYFVTM